MKKSILFCFPLILSAAYLSSCATSKTYSLEIKLDGPNQNSLRVNGTSSGEYKEGYKVNLEAQVAPGSKVDFDGFYVNEKLMSSTFTYSFELVTDTVVVVRWTEDEDGGHIDNPDQPDNPDNPNDPVNPPIDEDQIVTNATYQHTWEKGELSSNGGTTENINGISWNYDAITYLGYDDKLGRGVQIGSKNNPQKTPWKISTTIPDGVYVTGYSLDIASVNDGEATYEVKVADYSKSGDFTTKEITTISDENINKKGEEFCLTLTSIAGAMYITDFEIYFYVPNGVDFNVSGDNGVIEEPDTPDNPPSSDSIPPTKYKPITAEEYYKGIDFNQSSAKLFENLSDKISANITAYSYGEARYTLLYTDQKVGDQSHLYSLFDGDDLAAKWDFGETWNREHVWPKSKLGISDVGNNETNIATDLVNLRASCSNANFSHGNKYYGETTNEDSFYPNISGDLSGSGHKYVGDHRGDVARICFFMALRYDDKISLSDNPSGSYQMGHLSTLLKRNKEDPVDDFEIQRNNRIYEYQGNRNPFVDYSDLADKLF